MLQRLYPHGALKLSLGPMHTHTDMEALVDLVFSSYVMCTHPHTHTHRYGGPHGPRRAVWIPHTQAVCTLTYWFLSTSMRTHIHTDMKALVDLEDLFGPLIPDCDFVISTSDIPLHLAPGEGSQPPQPVMRFCRTDSHSGESACVGRFTASVLVPCGRDRTVVKSAPSPSA